MNYEQQMELNEKHALNPEIGDYWNEMFVPILSVVDVGAFNVSVLRKTKEVDEDHWTWDVTQVTNMTKKEFYKFLHYNTPNVKDKCWCDVYPGRDKAFAEAAKDYALTGVLP